MEKFCTAGQSTSGPKCQIACFGKLQKSLDAAPSSDKGKTNVGWSGFQTSHVHPFGRDRNYKITVRCTAEVLCSLSFGIFFGTYC